MRDYPEPTRRVRQDTWRRGQTTSEGPGPATAPHSQGRLPAPDHGPGRPPPWASSLNWFKERKGQNGKSLWLHSINMKTLQGNSLSKMNTNSNTKTSGGGWGGGGGGRGGKLTHVYRQLQFSREKPFKNEQREQANTCEMYSPANK